LLGHKLAGIEEDCPEEVQYLVSCGAYVDVEVDFGTELTVYCHNLSCACTAGPNEDCQQPHILLVGWELE
jgi:hypothetical protein